MSFINKDDIVLIEAKLTSVGRQLLAFGQLQFKKFAIGDSEINYSKANSLNIEFSDYNILRPIDNQPLLKYPILINSGNDAYLRLLESVEANERLVKNTANERGFFKINNNVEIPAYGVDLDLVKSAGKLKKIATNKITATNFSVGTSFGLGDMLLIDWKASGNALNTVGSIDKNKPSAWLMYKVVSINGMEATLDRPIAHDSGENTLGNFYAYYPLSPLQITHYENGVLNPYWDTESLASGNPASTNTTNVPVWNFSIIYPSSVTGARGFQQETNYESKYYQGVRSLFELIENPVGIVHYTNHTNNNYYGEAFVADKFVLELPTVMYHGNTSSTLGLTLTTDKTKKQLGTTTGYYTIYHDLISPSSIVVGKVIPDYKMVLIEDAEILASLSYLSNRNWTLPKFKTLSTNTGELTIENELNNNNTFVSKYILDSDTLYVTYHLYSDDSSSPTNYGDVLACQNILSRPITDLTSIDVSFNQADFTFLTNDGMTNGFSANKLFLLYQVVKHGEKLQHDKWIPIDMNPTSAALTPTSISSNFYHFNKQQLDDAKANAYNNNAYYKIDYFSSVAPSLNFGAEQLLLGNVKTDIEAITYTTTFRLQLDLGEYDTSINPTWEPGTPVCLSEVGIYDSNDNLVVIGKLNYPLVKESGEIILVSLDVDF